MFSAVLLSQSTVSSSSATANQVSRLEGGTGDRKLVCDRKAVCSSTPHLQFAEGTKPHLCIVERNCPTPVRRRFSLTQEGLGSD